MKGNLKAFWEKCGFVDNFIETENKQGSNYLGKISKLENYVVIHYILDTKIK